MGTDTVNGFTITPQLRDAVNKFVGKEVLAKTDEGKQLVDQRDKALKPDVNGNIYSAALNVSADGLVGIAYDGAGRGMEKIFQPTGEVTMRYCNPIEDQYALPQGSGDICKENSEHQWKYETVDAEKEILFIAGLFGVIALPTSELKKIKDPKAIEGAIEYFAKFRGENEKTTPAPAAPPTQPVAPTQPATKVLPSPGGSAWPND